MLYLARAPGSSKFKTELRALTWRMEISLASYYLCVGVPQASLRYLLEMHTLRPHSRLREPECAVQQDVPR